VAFSTRIKKTDEKQPLFSFFNAVVLGSQPQRLSTNMLDLTQPIKIEMPLRSLAHLQQFRQEQPHFFESLVENIIVDHCQRYGIIGDFLGQVSAAEVSLIGPECREHLFARGLNSRQRALCDAVVRFIRVSGLSELETKIYAHEALSPLALAMRGRFPRFI